MATPYRGFQLGLLPERKVNKKAMAASYGLVTLVVLVLVNIGLLMPEKLQLQAYHVVELIPMPALRPEPEPIKPKPEIRRPTPTVKIPVLEQPKLVVPPEVRHHVEQPIEPPKVVVNQFAAPQIKIAAATRPQLVHTGDFGTGSSAKPTVNAPIEKVQTGGFGDPNGLPGTGKQGAKLYAAALGSFDLPAGPGYGNGSGGAKGIKGTVASADFGSGVATAPKGKGTGQVSTGGFGSEQVVHGGPKIVAADAGPTTPVEITFKPNPLYTAEARNLKIEGEVVLEMSFGANGMLQVNRVVNGLGHGLDEAAITAAKQIRFKPALRNGQPVDSVALVHVKFQMAY
ncbi:MAG TPA: energy transducer TonB [Candidatus Acidoferrales bacterium]|nr:energy transducer TonB [Candidatus Acidoferrales bacterium]